MDFHEYQEVAADEKARGQSRDSEVLGPCKAHQKRQTLKNAAYFVVVVFIWWYFNTIPNLVRMNWRPRTIEAGPYGRHMSFDSITPSEQLEWHACYYDMCCARLTVPMDYNRPLNASVTNPKVHIALVLVPGKHTGQQKASTSPLLLNPGGPGGSGTSFAIGAGRNLQLVVGEDQDIIGFDPRGIGATTPRADCFSYPVEGSNKDPSMADSEDYIRGNFHRTMWAVAGKDIGVVNSSSETLKMLDARARSVGKLCGEKDAVYGNDSVLRYVNTPNVARDMLSIVHAWDDWRDRTGDSAHNKAVEQFTGNEVSRDTKGKLVYWGFSYGTLLGATFAAMFPDRVGRVILDGVVDADYYVSPVWRGSIQDADKVFATFSTYCHDAKEKCALYRNGDKVTDIDHRFQAVMDRVQEHPVTLIHPISRQPIVITHSHLKMVLFSTLYSPTVIFGAIATIFDQLSRGQDELLAMIFGALMPELEPACALNVPAEFFLNEAQSAIMCSDKRYPYNDTLPELHGVFEDMAKESSWADIWMTIMLACNAWEIKAVDPPMRWDDHPSHKADPIKTDFPLLFISNTADPVTPLAAGVKMARKFADAGLIEQHSEGHCSISAVSKCTIGKIREYLREGKVPSHPVKGGKGRELVDGKWDKCVADEWPFHPYDGGPIIAAQGEDGVRIAQRMIAMKEVQDAFSKIKAWGQGHVLDLDLLKLKRCGG